MGVKKWIVDYLKKFRKREELARIETPQPSEFINQNDSAYGDLEIEDICDEVKSHAPNPICKTENYIERVFTHPLSDKQKIKQRQDTIEELVEDEKLNQELTRVKIACDEFNYKKHFHNAYRDGEVQELENARLFVNLVDAIHEMSTPKTERLRQIKEFGEKIYQDEKFLRVKDFVRDIYEPADLGEVLAQMRHSIRCEELESIKARRNFYSGTKILTESIEKLITEETLKGFINNEVKGVKLLDTLKEKTSFFNEQLFKFAGSIYEFQRKHNRDYSDLLEYCVDVIHEAIYSRLPGLEIDKTGEELGFYLGAANLHKKWIEKGFPLTKPKILDKREKRTKIVDSYNTTLVGQFNGSEKKRPVPNDVISDKDANLFINTGPNNGGKTTYLRQVGQQYWLAQVGMLFPAKEAEISMVDGIFTSFSGEDSTEEGTGQYLTELKRVSSFAKPSNGTPTTPYSILFFDEFANGTDHKESVLRTKIVLDHISKKGVTAYFTTHKQEIADMVESEELPGSMNLASEINMSNGSIEYTYKIVRNQREKSYGHIQAEELGITPEGLRKSLEEEISRGVYPVEDTRMRCEQR